MRVYISADMEGICGVTNGLMTETDHPDFNLARKYMTADVNAAITGALAAGASEIVVRDAHGTANNILADDLIDGPVRLIQGWDPIGLMMLGLDDSFAAAILVGYHARVLTEQGAIAHTMTGQTRNLWYNDVLIGETGISAAHAGYFGVPVVCVTGDLGLAHEVNATMPPGVEMAVVKTTYSRECMSSISITQGHRAITTSVQTGLLNRNSITPFMGTEPITLRMEFQRPHQAAAASYVPTVTRVDELTVEIMAENGLRAAELVEVLLTIAPRR